MTARAPAPGHRNASDQRIGSRSFGVGRADGRDATGRSAHRRRVITRSSGLGHPRGSMQADRKTRVMIHLLVHCRIRAGSDSAISRDRFSLPGRSRTTRWCCEAGNVIRGIVPPDPPSSVGSSLLTNPEGSLTACRSSIASKPTEPTCNRMGRRSRQPGLSNDDKEEGRDDVGADGAAFGPRSTTPLQLPRRECWIYRSPCCFLPTCLSQPDFQNRITCSNRSGS
jgi:hypothetical protein